MDDPERAAEVARAVDDEFANSSHETKTETEKAFVQAFAKQMGNIGAILVAILTAVFFTILLVAGNTMAQSVRERTAGAGGAEGHGFHRSHGPASGACGIVCPCRRGGRLGLGLAWTLISRGDPTGGALPIFFFPVRTSCWE